MSIICAVSTGTCSMSTTRKSNPAQPSASAVDGAPLMSHAPKIVRPSRSARLNWLTGRLHAGSSGRGRRRAGRVAAGKRVGGEILRALDSQVIYVI